MDPSPTWNFGRFWQTLEQFGAIPLWSDLRSLWFPPTSLPPMTQVLLIAPPDRPWTEAIQRACGDRGWRVRRVWPDSPAPLTVASVVGCDRLIYLPHPNENPWSAVAAVLETTQHFSPGDRWLFDFRDPTLGAIWGAVDDVVMGGVSESGLRMQPDYGLFGGRVSIANNGGFASVRSQSLTPPLDLSGYQGFRLRLKGDGQRYKLIARCEGAWDGVGYAIGFDTIHDQWLTLDFPFSQLVPIFRARSVPEAGPFKADRCHALQLMLSKFEYDGRLNPHFSPGPFGLAIAHIQAYGASPRPRGLVGMVGGSGGATLGDPALLHTGDLPPQPTATAVAQWLRIWAGENF